MCGSLPPQIKIWKDVTRGEFYGDLYYKLKAATIYMPLLRERADDIPLLIDYFIDRFNRQFNKDVKAVSPDVMDELRRYPWPGNVRELEYTIQAAVAMSKRRVLDLDDFLLFAGGRIRKTRYKFSERKSNYGQIFQDVLIPILRDSVTLSAGSLYRHLITELEKVLINAVLDQTNNSQTKTVRILGISRNTLRTRMKEYGLL